MLKDFNHDIINNIYNHFLDELDIILVDRYYFIHNKIMNIKKLKIFDRIVKNFVYKKFNVRLDRLKITKLWESVDILSGKHGESKKFLRKLNKLIY